MVKRAGVVASDGGVRPLSTESVFRSLRNAGGCHVLAIRGAGRTGAPEALGRRVASYRR